MKLYQMKAMIAKAIAVFKSTRGEVNAELYVKELQLDGRATA